MQKLISRNPIQRFKQGNKIKLFQQGGYTIKRGDTLSKIAKNNGMSLQELVSLNPEIKDINKINVGQNIKLKNSNNPNYSPTQPFINMPTRTTLEDQKQFYKVTNDSRKTRIGLMQDLLWRQGAFKGLKNKKGQDITYKEAVDGKMGPLTQQAMQNSNYTSRSVSNPAGQRVEISSNQPVPTNDERKGHTVVGESFYENLDKLLNGNFKEGAKGMFKTGLDATVGGIAGGLLQRSYDNAYPFSYGDVIYNGNEIRPYVGGEIPEGWKLRQTTADDTATLQAGSLLGKFGSGLIGKDPRREHMEKMANIDLSTPEGIREWYNLVRTAPKGMVRIKGNPLNQQWEMRARLDQMNMYANRPQQWDTYEINSTYNSPTAQARGASTYRIKDPKQRERIHGEMVNYFLNHSKEGHWSNDGKSYILPHMGYMGNQSLVADDEKGTNLRYGDWWDYTVNDPYAMRFYTGDRLTEEGKVPVRTKYGIGHNSKHMTEQTDELFKKILEENNINNESVEEIKKNGSGFLSKLLNKQLLAKR